MDLYSIDRQRWKQRRIGTYLSARYLYSAKSRRDAVRFERKKVLQKKTYAIAKLNEELSICQQIYLNCFQQIGTGHRLGQLIDSICNQKSRTASFSQEKSSKINHSLTTRFNEKAFQNEANFNGSITEKERPSTRSLFRLSPKKSAFATTDQLTSDDQSTRKEDNQMTTSSYRASQFECFNEEHNEMSNYQAGLKSRSHQETSKHTENNRQSRRETTGHKSAQQTSQKSRSHKSSANRRQDGTISELANRRVSKVDLDSKLENTMMKPHVEFELIYSINGPQLTGDRQVSEEMLASLESNSKLLGTMTNRIDTFESNSKQSDRSRSDHIGVQRSDNNRANGDQKSNRHLAKESALKDQSEASISLDKTTIEEQTSYRLDYEFVESEVKRGGSKTADERKFSKHKLDEEHEANRVVSRRGATESRRSGSYTDETNSRIVSRRQNDTEHTNGQLDEPVSWEDSRSEVHLASKSSEQTDYRRMNDKQADYGEQQSGEQTSHTTRVNSKEQELKDLKSDQIASSDNGDQEHRIVHHRIKRPLELSVVEYDLQFLKIDNLDELRTKTNRQTGATETESHYAAGHELTSGNKMTNEDHRRKTAHNTNDQMIDHSAANHLTDTSDLKTKSRIRSKPIRDVSKSDQTPDTELRDEAYEQIGKDGIRSSDGLIVESDEISERFETRSKLVSKHAGQAGESDQVCGHQKSHESTFQSNRTPNRVDEASKLVETDRRCKACRRENEEYDVRDEKREFLYYGQRDKMHHCRCAKWCGQDDEMHRERKASFLKSINRKFVSEWLNDSLSTRTPSLNSVDGNSISNLLNSTDLSSLAISPTLSSSSFPSIDTLVSSPDLLDSSSASSASTSEKVQKTKCPKCLSSKFTSLAYQKIKTTSKKTAKQHIKLCSKQKNNSSPEDQHRLASFRTFWDDVLKNDPSTDDKLADFNHLKRHLARLKKSTISH